MHSDLHPALNTLHPLAPPANGAALLRKPRIWTVFAAWAAAALFGETAISVGRSIAGGAIGFVLGVQGMDVADIQARTVEILQHPLLALITSLLPYQLGILAIILLIAWQSDQPLKERLGLVPPSGRKLGLFHLALLAVFTLSAALATAIGFAMAFGQPQGNPVAATVENGSWWMISLASVLLMLLPAIVEEVVFRGYIQRRFLQRWSPAAAIGVSTVLFALLHADSLQHILAVVPLGIVTGLVAWRTNSVKPGMLIHAIHNAGAVGFGVLVRVLSPHLSEEVLGMAMIGAIAVLSLISLPALISLMIRAKTQRPEKIETLAAPAFDLLSSRAV